MTATEWQQVKEIFHQALRVAQSLDGRKGLLFDGAQQVLVAFFRRILIGFEAAHNRFNDDRLVFGSKLKAMLSIIALRKFSAISGRCCSKALETMAD